ncbi:MAG: calcium-binding protein [Pseudomonadota bacterium]
MSKLVAKTIALNFNTENNFLTAEEPLSNLAIEDRTVNDDRFYLKEGDSAIDSSRLASISELNVGGSNQVLKKVDIFDPSDPGENFITWRGIDKTAEDLNVDAFVSFGSLSSLLSRDDEIIGSKFDDTVDGFRGNDTIHGNNGRDNLSGGKGDDIISGGKSADVIAGGSGIDTINGDRGADQIRAGDGDDQVNGGDGNDTIMGQTGNDMIDGGAGNDTIRGDEGTDTLIGAEGDDEIRGGNSDDTIFGNSGADSLRGNGGADTMSGGSGQDLMLGGTGDDVLDGQGAKDKLDGGLGDDVLDGGLHNDTLTGGGGQDGFVFDLNTGRDKITDFISSEDVIDVSAYNFANAAAVLNATTDVGANAVIDLGDGNSVTIEGVLKAELNNNDFLV